MRRLALAFAVTAVAPLAGCTVHVVRPHGYYVARTAPQSAPPPQQQAAPPPAQVAPPPPQQQSAPPPPTQAYEEEPRTALVNYRWDIADGRPVGLHPNAPEAVWIWHDDAGQMWHVRTTTRRFAHRFSGLVRGSSGPITQLFPRGIEGNDRLRGTPSGVRFDFVTAGQEDGFDFRIAGPQCVDFWLRMDGREEPGRIFIGRSGQSPTGPYFRLCS